MTRLAVIDLMKVDGEGVEPEILAGAVAHAAADAGRSRSTSARPGAGRISRRASRRRSPTWASARSRTTAATRCSRSTPRWSARSIAAFSVDAVPERLAALERLDLLGDLARQRRRIGNRRDMRRDRDVVEIPERAVAAKAAPPRRRRGLRLRACRRGARSTMSASTCEPPRPALMRTGPPSGPSRRSFGKSCRSMRCRVSGVSGSSETRMSVPARNASSPSAPAKVSTPAKRLWRARPAADVEAEAEERRRRVRCP